MRQYRVFKRLTLGAVLLAVVLVASACYKDAGEDLQPTSRQVNLTDIAPTTPAPPPTLAPTHTALPTAAPEVTATRTLVPTTTPADFVAPSPTASPEDTGREADTASALTVDEPDMTPTQFSPSVTLEASQLTATEIVITTPGMSDIMPSPTPTPTIDPSNMPTPTAIPLEENPCIHIVRANDTLYSISQDNGVLLADLVAENPQYLGGNPNTPLQIGWLLQIPGCETDEEPLDEAGEVTLTPGAVVGTPGSGGTVIHVVQAGEGIYSIARQYGVEPQAIVDANGLANPNLIYPGDELIIPLPQ